MATYAVIGSDLHESTSSDHAHDVGLLHDQELLAIELDLGARPLAEQHPVPGLDVGLDDLAGLIASAWAHRDDLTLRRLLLSSIGNNDAALRFFLGIDAFHDHPVVQGTELGFGHMLSSGRLVVKPLTDHVVWRAVSTQNRGVPKASREIGGRCTGVKDERGASPQPSLKGTAPDRQSEAALPRAALTVIGGAMTNVFTVQPAPRWAHDQARRCATGARGQIRNPAASHLPWQGPTLRPKSPDRGLTGSARFHLVNHAVDKVGGSFALAPRWGGQK